PRPKRSRPSNRDAARRPGIPSRRAHPTRVDPQQDGRRARALRRAATATHRRRQPRAPYPAQRALRRDRRRAAETTNDRRARGHAAPTHADPTNLLSLAETLLALGALGSTTPNAVALGNIVESAVTHGEKHHPLRPPHRRSPRRAPDGPRPGRDELAFLAHAAERFPARQRLPDRPRSRPWALGLRPAVTVATLSHVTSSERS